jgi:hypothetical protein
LQKKHGANNNWQEQSNTPLTVWYEIYTQVPSQ